MSIPTELQPVIMAALCAAVLALLILTLAGLILRRRQTRALEAELERQREDTERALQQLTGTLQESVNSLTQVQLQLLGMIRNDVSDGTRAHG